MSTLSDLLAGGYRLVVDDRFDGDALDPGVWLPYYLPQWAGRAASRARYRLADGALLLVIEPDQEPWARELDGELRVSSLQTGVFSGPLGSTIGQHHVHPHAVVVEEQPTQRLLTPTYCAVELSARWEPHPDRMVALWMIGIEERPEWSAEICVCEIFGSEARAGSALIGMGVHPFGDPALVDDFTKVEVAIDVGELHDYAAVWSPDGVTFFVDGEPVHRTAQSPSYPMQFMLNIYDFGRAPGSGPDEPFVVERFRCYEPG